MNKKKLIILSIILVLFIIPMINIVIFKDSSISYPTTDIIKIEDNKEAIYVLEINNYFNYKYVYSDRNIIYVEDYLPNNMDFIEFVVYDNIYSTSKIKRNYYSDNVAKKSCIARIVDGKDGMHYDPQTRKISFKVANLSDRCVFSVGVKVRFNDTDTRNDHYNMFVAKNGSNYYKSNTIHTYVGNESATMHVLSYRINGEVPKELKNFYPLRRTYSAGQEIMLESVPNVPGYTFSGWSTNDVTVSNNKFTMPNKDVEFVGSFSASNAQEYKVSFKVEGKTPSTFVNSSDKYYKSGEKVILPILNTNDQYYIEYEITPKVDDLTINEFTMPSNNVEVTLKFVKNVYGIRYVFEGEFIPDTFEAPASTVDLSLPEAQRILYYVGEDEPVSLHRVDDSLHLTNDYKARTCTNVVDGKKTKCKFVGWYHNYDFNMPLANIDIRGLWVGVTGTFEPKIETTILNEKEKYYKGDVVEFKTTVKNDEDFDIKNVEVKTNLKNQKFDQSNEYTIEGDTIKIHEIKSKKTVEVFSSYDVFEEEMTTVNNRFQIIAAAAGNDYYLEDGEYVAESDFDVDVEKQESNVIPQDNNETNTTIIPESNTPKTGDDIWIYFLILGVSAIVIFVVIKLLKKKEE